MTIRERLLLNPATTALIALDLQQGIVNRQTSPHAAADVVARAGKLAERFRASKALVVLVRVAFSADGGDRLKSAVDAAPPPGTPAPNFSEIVPELGQAAGDVILTKRQWGAFYGTELDLQLRRRGIRTLVLTGISTNFSVESTARAASELGYALVFAEDAMSGLSEGAHEFSVRTIFPRIGRVRSTEEVLSALAVS